MPAIAAAILLSSAVTAGVGMYQANQQAIAQRRAQRKAEEQALENQNKLVEEEFGKRKQALGLGQRGSAAGGLVASQTGGVLTSVTDGNQASGL